MTEEQPRPLPATPSHTARDDAFSPPSRYKAATRRNQFWLPNDSEGANWLVEIGLQRLTMPVM